MGVEPKCVRYSDGNFPVQLANKKIKPPIERLWYRGNWDRELFKKCAAVVGSRRMSRYGKQAVEETVPRLCAAGYTIVSGLMYGVDQAAHRTALECGGRAIAVLGYGITNKNEETAWQMAAKIEEEGTVISEYEGNSVSQMWMFPQRNRIVVGLSEIVIVVEAGAKSGSLGTAKLAKEYGKKVYALPGPIFSPTSEGTNLVIEKGQAEIFTLNKLSQITGVGDQGRKEKSILTKLNANEREVYTILKLNGPMSINELARKLNTPAREVVAVITQMEIKGELSEERGDWRIV